MRVGFSIAVAGLTEAWLFAVSGASLVAKAISIDGGYLVVDPPGPSSPLVGIPPLP
jgi:hypothetical protein